MAEIILIVDWRKGMKKISKITIEIMDSSLQVVKNQRSQCRVTHKRKDC